MRLPVRGSVRISMIAAMAACGVGGYLLALTSSRVPPASAAEADEHAGHSGPVGAAAVSISPQQAATLPGSGQAAAQRLASSPRHGEWVAVKVGASDSVMAWVVYPERSTKAPVVIAIHENTGLTNWARGVADQLAADGFIGIAPDLLTMVRTGTLTEELPADQGRSLIGRITPDFANAALDAVAQYGMALPAAEARYGVIGFCWGGARSFLHATHAPALGASVIYYGSPPTAEQMAAIRAPVLGLYGGADNRINVTIPSADSAMKRLGKSYEYHIFDGAGHGFLRGQENSEANLRAAQQAWPRTVAFLKAKLGG
ncbi:MAG TPA: dienelactone hydrolase family protein [Gemmatimonadaceae bacterium]